MTFSAPIRRQSGRMDVRIPMPNEEQANKPIARVPDVHQSILEGWTDSTVGKPAKRMRVMCWDGTRMWQNCKYSQKRNQFENASKTAIKVFMWKKED